MDVLLCFQFHPSQGISSRKVSLALRSHGVSSKGPDNHDKEAPQNNQVSHHIKKQFMHITKARVVQTKLNIKQAIHHSKAAKVTHELRASVHNQCRKEGLSLLQTDEGEISRRWNEESETK
ncbi:unnamed protein product [Vicia faba]|uniref:Uncharacterized protein n=1 Tax=Vicia faba TaxID=3906 RepID=A0AAV0YN67_VICFA|nr:unnamed protein product [Vicia faba]